jgi:hypothetical protein
LSILEEAVVPAAAYVDKGSLLSVKYDWTFEPDSPRTKCIFRAPIGTYDTVENGVTVTNINYTHLPTPIVEHNLPNKVLKCFAPPAYLLSDELHDNGGNVDLFISTNGRDLSSNSFSFTFRLTPRIISMDPTWLLVNRNGTVTIHGWYFHDNNGFGGQYVILSPLDDYKR